MQNDDAKDYFFHTISELISFKGKASVFGVWQLMLQKIDYTKISIVARLSLMRPSLSSAFNSLEMTTLEVCKS